MIKATTALSSKNSPNSQEEAFWGLWRDIFTGPSHLDAALSRIPSPFKDRFAQKIGELLRAPMATAAAYGVSTQKSPFDLDAEKIAHWPVLRQLLEKGWLESQKPITIQNSEDEFPAAWVKDWADTWDEDVARQICEQSLQPPALTIRLSHAVKSSKEFLASLRTQEVDMTNVQDGSWSDRAVLFPSSTRFFHTQEFREGKFEVQNEGSQIIAHAALDPLFAANIWSKKPVHTILNPLQPQPMNAKVAGKWRVVDFCAGAGGKTLAIADAMRGMGQVFAYDISERKLAALRSRVSRTQLRNIKTSVIQPGNESAALQRFVGTADRVLVDAPCSGLGVLRKSPDIKWKEARSDFRSLEQDQLRILSAASLLVKRGGWLTYCVCTFRAQETIQMVEKFLQSHSHFSVSSQGYLGPQGAQQLDGFFLAQFQRSHELPDDSHSV